MGLSPDECPAASTHGSPFRYCGVCSWAEPSPPELGLFTFRPATTVTGPMHDEVRRIMRGAAADVIRIAPAGRHRSMALTSLQQAMWAANAAVALDTPDEETPAP